jgi:hypothetical protein
MSAHPVVTNQLIDPFLKDGAGRFFGDGSIAGGTGRIEDTPRSEGRNQTLTVRKTVSLRQRLKVLPPIGWNGLRIAKIVLI